MLIVTQAFSPVCTDELQLYEGLRAALAEQGVGLYGVSCDSTWAQSAFREKLGVGSEQLSDFEPKGAACEVFGVLHEGAFPSGPWSWSAPTGSCAGAIRRPRRRIYRPWSCCAKVSPLWA